jgi:hypothetical protein
MDGGYSAKNGARGAPVHNIKADGLNYGVNSNLLFFVDLMK